MRLRIPLALAAAASVLTVAMVIAAVVIGIADPTASSPADPRPTGPAPGDRVAPGQRAVDVLALLVCAAFTLAGAVVAVRRPRNPVGWLLCCAGSALALTLLAEVVYWHLAFGREVAPPAANWVAWVEGWSWIPAVVAVFGLVPLLFPTGVPPSPRWRVVGWTAAGAGAALLVATALKPGGVEGFPWIDNPLGVVGLGLEGFAEVAFVVFLASAVAAVISLVVRFRRSRGIERQQVKWVAAAGCLLLLTFAAAVVTSLWSALAGWLSLLVGLTGMAAAIAISLLRYRLYDLDVLVNRALVYGVLTATLAGVYVALVLLLQLVLSPSSGLVVAASTLALAALFRPLRGRIQALVDRRFYRRRYDATLTLERFGARLRDEVELDAVSFELRAVARETLQPAHVSLWLREPEAARRGHAPQPSWPGARSRSSR